MKEVISNNCKIRKISYCMLFNSKLKDNIDYYVLQNVRKNT